MSETNPADATYTIGVAARLTGLTTHTIRMWERRYGAVVAARAANGRRYYTPADIEKLSLLRSMTNQGKPISSIAGLSVEELHEQAREFRDMQAVAAPYEAAIGIFGSYINSLFKLGQCWPGVARVTVVDSNLERFRADIRQLRPEVLIIESATISDTTVRHVAKLTRATGNARAIVVYHYGTPEAVERLKSTGVSLLRAPVSVDDMLDAVQTVEPRQRPAEAPPHSSPADFDIAVGEDNAAPERRFSAEELASLANLPNSVICECPKHLAELIRSLTAFEVYSQECENRNEDDAALHRNLHIATARARAMMENALVKVIEQDRIQL